MSVENAMSSELKNEWTSRLRSGRYLQGSGALNKNGKFCCLGVLCEIAVEKGIAQKIDLSEDDFEIYGYKDRQLSLNTGILPAGVMTWAGIPWEEMEKVMVMNDEDKRSFEQIADYIESRF